VTGTADVNVTTSDATVKKGKSATVAWTVGNDGPDTATGVSLKLSAGSGVHLSSASSDQGSCKTSGSAIRCDLDDLASGATATVSLKLTGAEKGTASVQGHVVTSAEDSDTGNNIATATVTVKQSGGGGGGGAFGWLALFGLAALALGSIFIGHRSGVR